MRMILRANCTDAECKAAVDAKLRQIRRNSAEADRRHKAVIDFAHAIGVSTAVVDDHALTPREGLELLRQRRAG